MRSTIILITIILNPLYLLAQDEKKLSKKEANEEVRRLTSLVESLQLEKEELNNKLMIEYEKLLAEMDQNSNLRNANGELRSEIRSMQEQVLEFQKSFSEKETEIENLNNTISNYKSKLQNDSISIEKFDLLTQKQIIQLERDSIEIINLKDSLDLIKSKNENYPNPISYSTKIIAKYQNTEQLMGGHYELEFLLCNNCLQFQDEVDNEGYRWENEKTWKKTIKLNANYAEYYEGFEWVDKENHILEKLNKNDICLIYLNPITISEFMEMRNKEDEAVIDLRMFWVNEIKILKNKDKINEFFLSEDLEAY